MLQCSDSLMLECLLSQQEISVARTTHQLGLLVEQINFSMWSFFMTILVVSFMKNIIKSYFIPFHSSSETLFMVDEISKWGKVIDLPTIDSISLKSQTTLPTGTNAQLYCYVDTIIFCTFSLTQQQAPLNMQWWLYFLEKTG